MRILFVGDVVGSCGCEFLAKKIYNVKKEYNIDFTIINGENSAQGNGISKYSADYLTNNCGADVITTGNHAFRRHEAKNIFDSIPHLIRPANYSDEICGKGYYVIDSGFTQIAVVNLLGVVYLEPLNNPFDTIDNILSEISTPNIIVDFHAEATSEKKCMGHYLAKRVTAVIGTHTHVQTNDETILLGHTGYITDAGMCGPENSVLGVDTSVALEKMKTHYPTKFIESTEPCFLNAIVIEFDNKLGKCSNIFKIILR